MVKTNSPSFSTFLTKRKREKNKPFYDENPSSEYSPVQVKQMRHIRHVRYVLPIQNKTLNKNNNNNNILINPFNNPPSNCSESDVRWIWRKQLEQKRRHIRNTKYYNHYIGNSNNNHNNNNNNNKIPISYSNHHHLKHLVKIGCPLHDLSPILSECNYDVEPSICTHKSYSCCNKNLNDNNRILLGEISMKNVGLQFKRNAFSILPLHIRYNNFETDIYIKRIANTNFNKSFRPGSYGKLHSLKKGSWKEGKIFYVFENDELVLNICNGLYIVFDMKTNKSNNIIDGFENIVGGVGFYRPSQSTKIVSCLVFRKDPNFPMECLENSTIKIYALNNFKTNGSKLIIGDKIFDFSNNDVEINKSPFGGSLNCNNSLNSNLSNDTYDSSSTNTFTNITTHSPISPNSSDSCNNYNNYNNCTNYTNYNNCNNYNNYNSYSPNDNICNNNTNINDVEMKRNDFEEKYLSLQHQHNLLIAKNCKLQTLNKQLMESNSNLRMQKERQHKVHNQQIQQLQHYLEQQHKQINKLNQQINSIATPHIDQYSLYPLNNLEQDEYLPNFNNTFPVQDFQSI